MTDHTTGQAPRIPTGELVRRAVIVTLAVMVTLGLSLVVWQIRSILLWILIGIVLAIGLSPASEWLVRHGWRRLWAALVVSLLAVAGLVAAGVAVAIPVVVQAREFIEDFPTIVADVFGPDGYLGFLEERFGILERLESVTPEQVLAVAGGSRDTVLGIIGGVASFTAATVTVTTIMVMLLIQGGRAWEAILGVLVGEERQWAERIGQNFLRAVGGYVRGNLAISAVAGIVSYIVLRILGVPYAETLAVVIALLDIIPLVGATIAAVIVTLVGFASGGTVVGVALVIYFVLYQQFENNILQNIVYSKTVSLSPLVVFIAAIVGAVLAGIVGVLLAIPLTSAAWALGRDLLEMRSARYRMATGEPAGGGESGPAGEGGPAG